LNNPIAILRASFTPLRNPDLRLYLTGQAFSQIGTWMQVAGQGLLVFNLARAVGEGVRGNAVLGLVAMVNALPLLLFGLWTGVLADRFDRRKVLIVTSTLAMLLAFALATLTQTQTVQLWHVYLLSFLLGIVSSLDLPAQQAFLGDVVGMGEVRKAVNLNAMVLQISRVLGPASAGVLIAAFGISISFWINGLSYLAVIVCLLLLKTTHKTRASTDKPLHQIQDAFRFLRTQPRMQDLFIFALFVVLFVLSIVLSQLPAVAAQVLGATTEETLAVYNGALNAASGAGALFGVVIVVPLAQAQKRSGLVMGLACVWMGVWLLMFSVSTVLPLSIFCLFLGSIGAPTVMTMCLGLTQVMSPDAMRARVLSLFTMLSFGLQPIAFLIVGQVAERFGVQAGIQFNAVLLIVATGVLLGLRGDLRRWEFVPAAPATHNAGR
jgi:MFS family permease